MGMGLIRRLTLSVGVAVSVAATLTVASVGASGGFGQAGGKFTFTDTSGFTNFFDPSNDASINVSVDRSLFMFRPRAGGAIQTSFMTLLSVSYFVPNPTDPTQPPLVSDNICLVIPDSDFVISSDLQTATLNAVNESTLCPGFIVPITGAVPDAKSGGGGGGTGFTLPLTVTASWTGTGAVGTSDNDGSFRCGNFVATTHDHNLSALSAFETTSISGIGTFSGSGAPNAFGTVSVNTNVMNVAGSGILSAACGGGKGG